MSTQKSTLCCKYFNEKKANTKFENTIIYYKIIMLHTCTHTGSEENPKQLITNEFANRIEKTGPSKEEK